MSSDFLIQIIPFLLFLGSFVVGLYLKPKKGINRYGDKNQPQTSFLKSYNSTLKNFANFSGRTGRSEYFKFLLIFLIISILTGIITAIIQQDELKIFIKFLYGLHYFPFLAASVRRLHDTNRTGWWLLLNFTGIGAIITNVFLACPSSEDDNKNNIDLNIGRDEQKDAWEGAFWETENPLPVHAIIQIKYCDGKGQNSERIVTVRQFDSQFSGGMIIGHCHLRNATRTFRYDRIIECFDRETGEIILDIGSYLQKIYESSPSFSVNKLLETDYDTIRVLLYVGRADGSLRKPEKKS